MLRRALTLAAVAGLVFAAPAAGAEPDNLVPNGAFAACAGGAPEAWAPKATSILTCDSGDMRVTSTGGQTGDHWGGEGATSICVETPGISPGPHRMSFAALTHLNYVNIGTGATGVQLDAVQFSAPDCTGFITRNGVGGNPSSADAWYAFEGDLPVQENTASIRFELSAGVPVGNTALREGSFVLFDDVFLEGDGMLVTDCDDPALATVTEVEGDLVIAGVSGCGDDLSLPELVEVGGDLVIVDTDAAAIDVGSLESVGVDLDITGNTSAAAIDVGSLESVGVDLDISGNGTPAVVDLSSLGDVSGGVTVETGGDLDLGGVSVGADLDITGVGSDSVSATTAEGTTEVTVLGGTAAMHVTLPDGTFALPVGFTIERVADEPVSGGVDPLAGYRFSFDVPTLGQQAVLDFTVDLAGLDDSTRAALLAGAASGAATLAVRGDAVGDAYAALPRCASGQTPAADGCVDVALLGADGQPVAPGAPPAYVRFAGVAGHFSTWAVALVRPAEPGAGDPPPGGGDPAPNPTGEPSNRFGFGRLTRNPRRGTAALRLMLPGPGELALGGRGVRGLRRSVRGPRARLAIRPRGAARRRLARRGRVTVTVRVVYTPEGGRPRARTKRVTLVRR